MPIRRRPVRRAAVTGAVGYAAYNKGKKSAQPATPSQPTTAPAAAPTAPVATAPAEEEHSRLDVYLEIEKLGELKEKGLLSDSEFEREKFRLLG